MANDLGTKAKYYLTPRTAERTKATVQRKERYYLFPPRQARRQRQVIPTGLVPVVCPSGGIASGTQTSPTSGTGQLCYPTTVGSPGLTAAATNITLYNTLGVAVPSGSKSGFATLTYGLWYLVSWSC